MGRDWGGGEERDIKRGQPHHSCPRRAQVPQLGFDPSHRSFRFLHTTQAIRLGRGTSPLPPSLVLGLDELPMFIPNNWAAPKSSDVGSLMFIPGVCGGGGRGERGGGGGGGGVFWWEMW